MGLSKSLKKIAKHTVAPVFSLPAKGIEKLSGLTTEQQLMAGAGVGTAGYLMRPGASGGGATAGVGAGTSSASGVFRAFGAPAVGNLLPALLAGGAALYGGHEQADAQREANAQNIELAREQMQFSAGQAQREMEFQERMSSTSYQRGVEDMKKAGINPMLAIGNGGASSPGGASGSYSRADVDAVPSVVSNSITSAMDMLRSFAGARQASAQASLAESQKESVQQDTKMKRGRTPETVVEGRIWSFINRLLDSLPGVNSGKSIDRTLDAIDEKIGTPEKGRWKTIRVR